MHNNYFFLLRLIDALNARISGFSFGEIFSQNKDELIIGLYNENEDFYIKALLSPMFSCLSFPADFNRAKRNSVDLFPELIDRKIQNIEVFENDRSFRMMSAGGYSLVFKLYGNRSNVLLFNGESCQSIFKQKFVRDSTLKLSDFGKKTDLSYEHFLTVDQQLHRFIPTLGKDLAAYVESSIGKNLSPEEKWKKGLDFADDLANSQEIYIDHNQAVPELSLIKKHENTEVFTHPIEALNAFFNEYTRNFFLNKKKNELLNRHQQQIKKAESYIKSAEKKLYELEHHQKYNQIADIIMANLHQIKPGSEEAELFDFYNDKNIRIRLKKELTPQKNAENFYRKAKNQKIEVAKLKENIEGKEKEAAKHRQIVKDLETANDPKALKTFRSEIKNIKKAPEEGFHRFYVDDFEILVGKNAKRNDELTFKVAHKNDLWLHAKDSPGSHVIIRQIPGKPPGEKVLEKAASLAAFYSKRKTEGLVPVSYTERKYVRKTKDLAPGQVIVEKEKVLLAEPVNWTKNQ